MIEVHPVVRRTLDIIDAASEVEQSALDEVDRLRIGVVSTDGDLALTVDAHGMISDVWLRPGVLDAKKPHAIAHELTELSAAATERAYAQTKHLMDACTDTVSALCEKLPAYEEYFPTVVTDSRGVTWVENARPGADPDIADT